MTQQATDDLYVVGMKVNATSYEHCTKQILDWARQGLSKYVCFSTVNNVMESYDSPIIQAVMNQADMVTPDGMPIVWASRLLGRRTATRVYGPDLTPLVLAEAARQDVPVGFYGGAPEVLNQLVARVERMFPALKVAYACSPPFRQLTPAEDEEVVRAINDSGAKIVFIGLNSPKQDLWMATHRGRVQAVMLGVGAAFDFIAGSKKQAPRWMMGAGLEWLFRLSTEPRRLWRRYLKHNPRFVLFFALQILGARRFNVPSRRTT